MIQHQNHKLIYNNQTTFELPNGICFDFHPEASLWEDGFQLIAPDNSFKLVLVFLTVEKSAQTFASEIYEEHDNVHAIEPVHMIKTKNGLKGYATIYEYTDEIVEEITLDLPGKSHALLNIRLWRRKQSYNESLYTQAKNDILNSVQAL